MILKMAQYIMNMDRVVNPRPVTFISPVDGLYRGMMVEIVSMATNDIWLDGTDDFEAYKVQLADGDTEKKNLLINTTVPFDYDERKDERDFVCNKGAICRGHYITTGDEYTIAQDFVANSKTAKVGNEVVLAEGGKLAMFVAGNGTDTQDNGVPIGEVVKVYVWNGQPSVLIRFY